MHRHINRIIAGIAVISVLTGSFQYQVFAEEETTDYIEVSSESDYYQETTDDQTYYEGSEYSGDDQSEIAAGDNEYSADEYYEGSFAEDGYSEGDYSEENYLEEANLEETVSEETNSDIKPSSAAKPIVRDTYIVSTEEFDAAYESFGKLLADKDLAALVYTADTIPVYKGSLKAGQRIDASEITDNLESGYSVYPIDVYIEKEYSSVNDLYSYTIYYRVRFYVNQEEKEGFVDGRYLAYADEDWKKWEEEYLSDIREFVVVSPSSGIYKSDYSGDISEDELAGYTDIEAFPSSYQSSLITLKQSHPNWTFVPVKTGLDFNYAVNCELGDASWINYTTSNKAAGYLGNPTGQSGWYYASQKGVSHFMDPRTYLDAQHIFAFEQLTYNSSYHSEEVVQGFLSQTFMCGNIEGSDQTYANAFYNIGKSRRLSPVHLAARVKQEQGTGTSPLISGSYPGYEGYYNYFNIGASGKTSADVIVNGLSYAQKNGWNTRYKALDGGAAIIGSKYILRGQDTIYLEKYNVSPDSASKLFTHQYMQNIQAPSTEAVSTYKMYSNAECINNSFVFKIPVYNNMSQDETFITEVRITNKEDASSLLVGESFTLAVDFWPTDTIESTDMIWSSSDEKIVSVSDGVLKAEAAGSCEISVTMGVFGISDSFTVSSQECEVNFYKADGVSILKKMSASFGQKLTEADFPSEEELGLEDLSLEFEGWYARLDDRLGEKITAGSIVSSKTMSLVPYYEKTGEGFYIVPIGSMTYTGSILRPEVEVYDSNTYVDEEGGSSLYHKRLVQGEDYRVSYKNTRKPSSKDSNNPPTVVITGIGNYSGTQQVYFDIKAKSLRDSDISYNEILMPYTGRVIKASPVIYRGDRKLVKGMDYTLSYPSGGERAYIEGGVWPITVTGKGGYTGSFVINEVITKSLLLSNAQIARIAAKTYTGDAIEPEISVSYNREKLVAGRDFMVSYSDNVSIGNAIVTISAVSGSGYIGSKSCSFKIIGTGMNKVKVRSKSKTNKTGIINRYYSSNSELMLQDDYELYDGEYVLSESTDGGITGDYTVSYDKADRVGTASVVFTGINKYSGSLKRSYRITSLEVKDTAEESNVQVYLYINEAEGDHALSGEVVSGEELLSQVSGENSDCISALGKYVKDGLVSYPYHKGGVAPVPVIVYNGRVLRNMTDYRVTYRFNTAVNDAGIPVRAPAAVIKGYGSFRGTITKKFVIEARDFTALSDGIYAPDVIFSPRGRNYRTVPVIYDTNGKKLSLSDYSRNYIYSYDEDTDLDGDGVVDKTKGTEIGAKDIIPAGTTLRVSVFPKTTKSNYFGDCISCTYKVAKQLISSGTIRGRIQIQEYTGRKVEPRYEDIELTSSNKIILDENDYEIVSYSNNIKKGRATVTVRGIGDYGGTRNINFYIGTKGIIWRR